MASQRIKKGDKVIVLSGKDKGKTGEVTVSMPKTDKVVVSGVNIAVRHTKPTQGDPQGGLIRKEAPMHVSKVAHVTADGKPTRVRFEEQDGKKVRVAVKTGGEDQWLIRTLASRPAPRPSTSRACASCTTRRSSRR